MKTLTTKITHAVLGLSLFAAICLNIGCGSDFYLSESETAAYAAPFTSEAGANNLFADSIVDPNGQDPNKTLRITFDNTVSPPVIQSTNLAPLLRGYTNYGLMEGVNRQIQLDRLSSQLQTQASTWIQNELQLYTGANGAGVQLTKLNSITLSFVTKPTFVFHPDTQSIEFHVKVRLTIDGTLTVDALDFFTNWLAGGVNGTYPLNIVIQDLDLNGTASFNSGLADASNIAITIVPTVGTLSVFDGAGATSAAPDSVKDGVRDTVKTQLSVPLTQTFLQRYDYFALGNIGLSTGGTSGPSLQHTYRDFPENAKPMEHIVARSSDGSLYYFRKTEGGQGVTSLSRPFPTLDKHIENEPALIASAADQLELTATTVDGYLVYADRRDETWTNQTVIAPTAATGKILGKPAIVASAPGQVEIIVATQSGKLYHFRRINGQWLPAAAIPTTKGAFVPTLPLRNPSAVQTGNKIVLTAVDASNRPFAMAYDMESESWGYAVQLSTSQTTTFAPAIAASGNGTVDVVYVNLSKAPFHRRLTVQAPNFNPAAPVSGLTLDPSETAIGGVLNASPSLQCSGLHQLELVGRSTDNRLYHNHFVGDVSPAGARFGRTIKQGWQGWTDLNGNFSGTLTFEQMSAFSTAVSGSGKLAVAAITLPSPIDTDTQQFPYLNSYDTERFGTQPWNTVLWRGYEQAGAKRFLGQPAIAVTDRNATLAYVNTSYQVRGGRLTDDDSLSFSSYVTSSQVISSTPVDPVIATSLPGTLDILTVSPEGALRHMRRFGKTATRASILPQPNSVVFQKQPTVVAYGNGFLEVVAVSTTGSLWHWRYLNGAWMAPVQVSGNVVSRPALVNFGGGQFMLLALGTDRRMYFWGFDSAVWSGFWSAPSNLVINENYFNSQSMAGWGDGTVDLAMVENGSGALYHGRFTAAMLYSTPLGEAFKYVGGVLTDTPLLTAVSPYRVIVLAIGTDRRVYSASTTKVAATQLNPLGIQWSGYFGMGGAGNRLSSIAKVGANEMSVAGIDGSGKLSISRYNGAVWSQFQSTVGPDMNLLSISAAFRPQLSGF
jgi:hypothetical protein